MPKRRIFPTVLRRAVFRKDYSFIVAKTLDHRFIEVNKSLWSPEAIN